MTIDQAGRDPGTTQRHDLGGAKAGEFGALADADDLPILNADRRVGQQAERIAGRADHGRGMTVDEQAIPHGRWH